jgi:uncharacterized Fe-S cluster-containing radical SAM superfamily protein
MEVKINKSEMIIDTDAVSDRYRRLSVDTDGKRLLVTKFSGTEQEKDFTEPANCEGFGRIRHFRRESGNGWMPNPLPIDPARKALKLPAADIIRAQVFQNAVCNWRCWYCFVPFELLAGNRKYSDWLSPSQLLDLYLKEPNPPLMIDLTGGQPDITPEWVAWMMNEIKERGLEENVYLWSDDNLSNDYFWQFLSEKEREMIGTYQNYGRVCCFKGFNSDSFAFNTLADANLFQRQFELMKRLLTTGIDLYAYATFTTPSKVGIEDDMRHFVDELQKLNENLPLRTVPLQVEVFTPVQKRLDEDKTQALKYQWIAVEAWQKEMEKRFSCEQRSLNIADVPLKF